MNIMHWHYFRESPSGRMENTHSPFGMEIWGGTMSEGYRAWYMQSVKTYTNYKIEK